MSDRKIIAVAGATGAQGGGLARAILADPEGGFAVRALTRDPSSDAAKALADQGAEVVQADVDDEASLAQAYDGAYGAYCVTFFWDHFSVEREQAEAGNMARAAKTAGLRHVIWSTFEDTRELVPLDDDRMPTLQGNYKVPHFDSKGSSNHLFTDAGVPTTFLLTSFYWENFIYFGMGPARGEDGVLRVTFPLGDKKLPSMAAEDIGKVAYEIYKRGDEFIGKTVGVAGEHLDRRGDRGRLLEGARRARRVQRGLGRRRTAASASPEPTTSGTCSSSSATSTTSTVGARPRVRAVAEPLGADLRPVARGQREPGPDRRRAHATSGRRRRAAALSGRRRPRRLTALDHHVYCS